MADTLLPAARAYLERHGAERRRTPCIVHELSEPCDDRGFCDRHRDSDYIAEWLVAFVRRSPEVAARLGERIRAAQSNECERAALEQAPRLAAE